MSVTIKCPRCSTPVTLSATTTTTCPTCLETLASAAAEQALSARAPRFPEDKRSLTRPPGSEKLPSALLLSPARRAPISGANDLNDMGLPAWISPWGVAAFVAATLALLLASLVAIRVLTIGLAALGVVLIGVGLVTTRRRRQTRDWVWFSIGGILSLVILVLALFLPSVLNDWWALDSSVPSRDPNRQVAVPRDEPQLAGRALGANDWADAVHEAIRQDEVLIRLAEAKIAPLPGRGPEPYLQIQMRLGNAGHGAPLTFEGFSNARHKPTLADNQGHTYSFVEQWPRNMKASPVGFHAVPLETVEIRPTSSIDLLLIFEAPPATFGALYLELPAAAWGREGICRLKISGLFKAPLPELKKK